MPETTSKQKQGLPLPISKQVVAKQDEKKLAAAREYIAGIRDIAGTAGDVALRSFAQGVGIDFKISDNELVSEVRPKGDKSLYIDGKPIGDAETIELVRGYLKSEYESKNKKKK